MTANGIDDEDLVAYLDGELSAERAAQIRAALESDVTLRDRLSALQIDTAAVRSAFDSLLDQAPAGMLKNTTAPPPALIGRRATAIAASLLIVAALGFTMGRFSAPPETEDWRMAVAEYQLLYRSETLSHLVREDDALERERARVVARLGLDIDGKTLMNLDGLSYRRAQLLGFEDAPLVQFAYLDGNQQPLAFCVTPTGAADRPVESANLKGLSAASWIAGGYAFLVIGDIAPDHVRRTAETLAGAIGKGA
ncbi:hypothetical protein HBA54_03795 [Pelagibius litoralis]|uniref:Transmembrane transcriptional regulator (Anti-sigma factor RsiW) n=1 Tax=Pelagibius litoralis TaxID=374515 RepID=A0A967C3D8_9PROT|nr:zf-HC2 domain-containing protein [Pelagibius litoralis]NIA67704.1 hypothetical protein [Pelagibius litoralis]